MSKIEPLLMRAPEVAEVLGVKTVTVYKLIQEGKLPSVRIGKSVRVSRATLYEWIQRGGTRAVLRGDVE